MNEGKVIIEANDSGGIRIALEPAKDGSIWMNAGEIARLFSVSSVSVERQIKQIFSEGDLLINTVKKVVPIEYASNKYGSLEYYNLNMIIMLAFRMKGPFCGMFRTWICEELAKRVSEQKVPIVLQFNQNKVVN